MLAMITGGIDLSVVSIASLSGVVSASFLSQYQTLAMAPGTVILIGIVIALAVSMLCGLLNGVIIAFVRVPAIIATLGTQGLFLGVAIIITKGHGIGGFPPAFLFIGNGSILGMPTQFVIYIVVALLVGLVLTRTPQGFSMLMYGSSPQVSRFSAINNEMILIRTYILTGLLAGVSSLVIISGVNSIRPGYGADYLLLSVLIAILGGTDPVGGFGTVLGLTLAIFIMQILQSGLNILSFSPFMKKFIWGLLLLLVMVIHYYRRIYAQRRAVRRSADQREALQNQSG
jgi:simple sugar transport system permease protein